MKKSLLRAAAALSLCIAGSRAYSAVPYQVADLRTKPAYVAGSWPSFVGSVNGAAIFTTADVNAFHSLWRTDGTAAGTYRLRQSTEDVYSWRAFPEGVYVTWLDTTGSTLWKSDGAHLDAVASSPTQRILALGSAGQKLFLLAKPSGEIWVRDGSTVTTVATLPIHSSGWISFGELGGVAYIGSDSGLWRSDGTASGTYSISPVPAYGLTTVNGRLIYPGQEAETGTEFWSSDGTSAGTHIITDAEPGPASLLDGTSALTLLGSRVLFLTTTGTLGYTDGTVAGTQVLRRGGGVDKPQFAVLGSNAFFPFDDGAHGKELWVTDGTAAGTRMVRDASTDPNPDLGSMSAGATRIYYFVWQASQKPELFESDGTEAGTHAVFQRGGAWIGPQPTHGLTVMGDQVFFTANDGETGDEPWISDGTDSGTHLIANVATETVGSSNPKNLTGGGDQIYFTGWSDDDVWKLWRSDATANGTSEVFRLQFEPFLSPLFAKGSKLFLPNDYQTTRVIDHVAGTDTTIPCHINFQNLRTDGNLVYSNDHDLWCITDGTAEGTSSEWTTTWLSSMTILGDRPYFLSGGYLLTIDGSPASMRSIAGAPDGTVPVSPLFAVRGSLLFFGTLPDSTTTASTTKLWRFSGSVADASPLVSFEGVESSIPTWQLGDGTLLFVWASQLWRTDGTAAGTSLLHDFSGGSVKQIAPVGTRAIFIAGDAEPDSQLWVTDGTAEGTSLLHDFDTGSATELVTTGRAAYFVGNDADHGREIWTSDGTVAGTQLVSEILAGSASAEPHSLAVAGDSLFFAATTAESGTELWALSAGANREVSIRDSRAREDQLSMAFEVRLSAASDTPVTVSYATEDGTAHAGVDYTATSSTLVFAPGETTRTISVPIADNSTYSGMRYFLVRIASVDGLVSRAVGAGVIEEDDISSDLEIRVVVDAPHTPYLLVRNNGPAPASNVRLCYVTDPYASDPTCRDLSALKVGGTLDAELYSARFEATFAGVSGAEPDPDPTNNRTSYFMKQYLIASPAHAAAGTTGLLVATAPEETFDRRGTFTSSDASIVTPLPAEFTLPGSVTETVGSFSALKPGVAKVSLWVQPSYYYLAEVPIRVYPSIEDARRLTPNVTLDATRTWYRGDLNEITARVSGCTPELTRPTGVVSFLEGATEAGSTPVANQTATITLPSPTVGAHYYYASYGGDANFFGARSTYGIMINVYAPVPVMTLESVPGTSSLRIVLNGRAGHTPAGSITVTEGSSTSRAVDGPLQPYGVDASFATASGFSSATRSITIAYPGDAYYDPSTQTFPIILHGDPNGDAVIDAADVFYLVNYLYGGGPLPIRDADCNGDGVVTVVDLFYLINYVFAGGAAPL